MRAPPFGKRRKPSRTVTGSYRRAVTMVDGATLQRIDRLASGNCACGGLSIPPGEDAGREFANRSWNQWTEFREGPLQTRPGSYSPISARAAQFGDGAQQRHEQPGHNLITMTTRHAHLAPSPLAGAVEALDRFSTPPTGTGWGWPRSQDQPQSLAISSVTTDIQPSRLQGCTAPRARYR